MLAKRHNAWPTKCRVPMECNREYTVEMCMGMGFPMGPGIPWESHGNGNKTQNWEWEWEGMGMGNHLSGNGNYLDSRGNLFPKVLCCDELIKLLSDRTYSGVLFIYECFA